MPANAIAEVKAMFPQNVLYYGHDEPLPERREVTAGPLTALYENGGLRYVKLGEREILRRVYMAVRDRDWGTLPTALSNVKVSVAPAWFRVSFDALSQQGEADFRWHGEIKGEANGTITLSMDGVAHSTFLRRRIGWCVLHPIRECAGQPCKVEKTDGAVEQGIFPQFIAPHQPFMDMRAISHEVQPGVWAEVRFAGDVFEMEDQRNWTDASFKTYSTPLALPAPVEVRAGTRISQSITLTLKGQIPKAKPKAKRPELTLAPGQTVVARLPRIGVGVASHGQPLSAREVARLQCLRLAHLRVELDLTQPGYSAALRGATAQAKALGSALEIALLLSDAAEEELRALRGHVSEIQPPVHAWFIHHHGESSASAKWVGLAREYLGPYDPASRFGGGSRTNFTELNRARPPIDALGIVCYALNPQVHAFDNTSIVEALEGQGWTVASARRFTGSLPLAIGPITLKPRPTGLRLNQTPNELPPQVDVRQMSLLGTAWTVGSLKYLAEAGVHSLTYYETTGWLGLMEREEGAPLAERFRSTAGMVFPLYHVLADVGEFADGEVLPSLTSDPLRVEGLALRQSARTRVLVANMTGELQSVLLQSLSERVRVRTIDETSAPQALSAPELFRARDGDLIRTTKGSLDVTLLPYAVMRIDTASQA
jgi:D-apionolactonase